MILGFFDYNLHDMLNINYSNFLEINQVENNKHPCVAASVLIFVHEISLKISFPVEEMGSRSPIGSKNKQVWPFIH